MLEGLRPIAIDLKDHFTGFPGHEACCDNLNTYFTSKNPISATQCATEIDALTDSIKSYLHYKPYPGAKPGTEGVDWQWNFFCFLMTRVLPYLPHDRPEIQDRAMQLIAALDALPNKSLTHLPRNQSLKWKGLDTFWMVFREDYQNFEPQLSSSPELDQRWANINAIAARIHRDLGSKMYLFAYWAINDFEKAMTANHEDRADDRVLAVHTSSAAQWILLNPENMFEPYRKKRGDLGPEAKAEIDGWGFVGTEDMSMKRWTRLKRLFESAVEHRFSVQVRSEAIKAAELMETMTKAYPA